MCRAAGSIVGERWSEFSNRSFSLASCEGCGFSWVCDPRTDFDEIYNEAYYRGRGADPLANYERELVEHNTIRTYEWRGIVEVLRRSASLEPSTRWLDFGCGLGGLVRYARESGFDAVYGFDEGYAARRLEDQEIPSLSRADLEAQAGSFAIVTAIEVLEHSSDPLSTLREIQQLLAPGGVLFVTTGNAQPFRGRISKWSYTSVPDVHVSFFEPRTLNRVYREVGLEPLPVRFGRGFKDIIRFKVLKNMRAQRRGLLERLVPWAIVSRLVDARYRLSKQPSAVRASQ